MIGNSSVIGFVNVIGNDKVVGRAYDFSVIVIGLVGKILIASPFNSTELSPSWVFFIVIGCVPSEVKLFVSKDILYWYPLTGESKFVIDCSIPLE